jgi:hypothetical protein
MDFVVTFDALALSDSQRLQDFVDAFAVPMVDAGILESYPEDLVGAIDEALADETDFSLSADILPWIGRSVSLAGSMPEFDPMTLEVGEFSFLLSADVRDRAAAETFVSKILNEMAHNDLVTTATTIGGLPGYTWRDDYDEISFGLVLTDDALLIGVEQSVADAIAAHDAGLSIADDAMFADVVGRLPGESMVSFYIAGNAFDDFLKMSTVSPAPATSFTDLVGAMGASVSLVDEGVLLSYVVSGTEEAAAFIPDRDVLAALPDDTLGFFSTAASTTGVDVDQQLAGYGDVLDQLSSQTGVDIAALLESLSGDVTLAVTETRNGLIASESDVPIGIVAALGLTDAGPVTDVVAMIEESMGSSGAIFEDNGGVTTISGDGQELVSYSIGSDLLVVGTSEDLVSGIMAGGDGGPPASDLYQELDRLVVGDGLVGYADIGAITGLIPMTREEAAVVAPLRGLGIGGDADGTISQVQVLVLVDY